RGSVALAREVDGRAENGVEVRKGHAVELHPQLGLRSLSGHPRLCNTGVGPSRECPFMDASSGARKESASHKRISVSRNSPCQRIFRNEGQALFRRPDDRNAIEERRAFTRRNGNL